MPSSVRMAMCCIIVRQIAFEKIADRRDEVNTCLAKTRHPVSRKVLRVSYSYCPRTIMHSPVLASYIMFAIFLCKELDRLRSVGSDFPAVMPNHQMRQKNYRDRHRESETKLLACIATS